MKEYPLAHVPRTASDDQLGEHCRISYSRYILFSAFLDKCKRFKLCGFGRFGGLGQGGGWWCGVFVVWDFWRRFNFCYIHLTSANVNRSHLWQRDTATTIRWKFLKEVASSHSCVCLRSDSLLTTSAVGSLWALWDSPLQGLSVGWACRGLSRKRYCHQGHWRGSRKFHSLWIIELLTKMIHILLTLL